MGKISTESDDNLQSVTDYQSVNDLKTRFYKNYVIHYIKRVKKRNELHKTIGDG